MINSAILVQYDEDGKIDLHLTFKQELSYLMWEKGIKAYQLGAATGVSPTTISLIMQKKRPPLKSRGKQSVNLSTIEILLNHLTSLPNAL